VGSRKRQLSDDERSVLLSELLLRHPELGVGARRAAADIAVSKIPSQARSSADRTGLASFARKRSSRVACRSAWGVT
jgi:hypothetical protein